MKGFCTRSILSIEMWSFIDFRNNCSTSLYSFDDVVNMTRIYCPSGGMEDQWFGTLYIAVLFSIFLLLEESPCALQKMENMKKLVTENVMKQSDPHFFPSLSRFMNAFWKSRTPVTVFDNWSQYLYFVVCLVFEKDGKTKERKKDYWSFGFLHADSDKTAICTYHIKSSMSSFVKAFSGRLLTALLVPCFRFIWCMLLAELNTKLYSCSEVLNV